MATALRIHDESSIPSARERMIDMLTSFTERFISEDGAIILRERYDNRFYRSGVWDASLFCDINQFSESAKKLETKYRYSVNFCFANDNLNIEAKFIFYRKIFNEEWCVSNFILNHSSHISRVIRFVEERYPNLSSFLELDIEEVADEWCEWLESEGTCTMTSIYDKERRISRVGRGYIKKTSLALYLPNFCQWLHRYLDDREEWEKESWDVRNLEKYGVSHNKSAINFYIHFHYIEHPVLRRYAKEYIKLKLMNKTFAWNTASMYMSYLPMFFNKIIEMEPCWNSLRALERSHIINYITWLDEYICLRPTSKKSNPEQYKNRALTIAHRFLSDMQLYEIDIAPIKDVRKLIFPEDKPKIPKKAYDKTDYIPDFVLDQLFEHINDLHPDAVPVVWVMYKTGFRISDALLLRQNCLIKLNGKYWIEADIEKTFVKGHRVPIDDELAGIVARLIDLSEKNSNQYNNPDKFIFARLTGSRRGKPIGQDMIREYLNMLARTKRIRDETGNLYHFTNHAFRHTYAVKLLNGGADIITIQELLAHASPEMTMRYARLLDDNKRKAFDHAVKQGIFSFCGSTLLEIDDADISADILDRLWINHKLDAVDTPYGTCLQRAKGSCGFAKSPPCLTCNTGNPCVDLCIGAFEGDMGKYEVLISSAASLAEHARKYGREDMARENDELLTLYKNVYDTIRHGNLVYGRIERLRG